MWQFRRVNFLVGSCLGVIFGLKLWVVFVGGSFFPRGEFSGSNYLGDFFGRGRFFLGGGIFQDAVIQGGVFTEPQDRLLWRTILFINNRESKQWTIV